MSQRVAIDTPWNGGAMASPPNPSTLGGGASAGGKSADELRIEKYIANMHAENEAAKVRQPMPDTLGKYKLGSSVAASPLARETAKPGQGGDTYRPKVQKETFMGHALQGTITVMANAGTMTTIGAALRDDPNCTGLIAELTKKWGKSAVAGHGQWVFAAGGSVNILSMGPGQYCSVALNR